MTVAFHANDLFRTHIGFDMRVPDFGPAARDVYAVALEMVKYADKHGIDKVDFQEHHGSEDGYLPTPFLMGAAAAACTKDIAIVLGAVILPFHDPVKIAEQIAVGDLISGGRLHVVLAGGYVEREFQSFGVSLHDRAWLMEEGIGVVLRALTGERFQYKGREVYVRPLPSRPPTDIVYGGGGAAPAARRAARFGLGMWPMVDDLIPVYEAECRKLGRKPGKLIRMYTSVYVSDDPDRGWNEIAPHILHVARMYATWSSAAEISKSPWHGIETLEDLKKTGMVHVVTPDQAVAIGKAGHIGVTPLMGGLKPELGWKSLEFFATKVLPLIKGSGKSAG
jgi:alkanesulfonate monooxygenase SsuD/methylene tetrahydromethanopterin reductase-like flavin-dependent oxidoreductase (luciferase family)